MRIKNSSKYCRLHFLGNGSTISAFNYFRKKLHLRCLTGFWLRLWNRLNIEPHLTETSSLKKTYSFQFFRIVFWIIGTAWKLTSYLNCAVKYCSKNLKNWEVIRQFKILTYVLTLNFNRWFVLCCSFNCFKCS